MRAFNYGLVVCFLAGSSAVSLAENLQGKVIQVMSGDSCLVQIDQGAVERIRFSAIDAPDLKQTFGKQSQQHLTQLILGKTVAENKARQNKIGLWSSTPPQAPWAFRQENGTRF